MRATLAALLAAASLLSLSSARCAGAGVGRSGPRSLSVVSYNVKSLFDAKDDGPEFAEYSVARGRWDEARYRRRLENLAQVIFAALPDSTASALGSKAPRPRSAGARGPDIVCLLEIENRRVLDDLRSGPLKAGRYEVAAMAEAEGSAINSAILSRLPLLGLKAHAISVESASTGSANLARTGRNTLEATFDTGLSRLTLFLCHLKSKLGGGELTEKTRREEVALVGGRIVRLTLADPGAEILVCGDFNESPDEYLRVARRYETALMPDDAARDSGAAGAAPSRLLVAFDPARAGMRGNEAVLFSPWAESDGYSYAYKGARERIDGFLLSGGLLDAKGLRYGAFSVVDPPFLFGKDGQPLAWSSLTATGYSDHLPILLLLEDG